MSASVSKRHPEWDGWRFIFNAERESYDYLVVCHDLHASITPACPRENILHLSTESPFLKQYTDAFLAQFGWIITNGTRPNHPNAILYQPGLTWYIGWRQYTDSLKALSYHELKALFDQPKTKLLSIISSAITATAPHKMRLEFAQKLKSHYGDQIDFYGLYLVTMDDKLEALRDYRFHIVLENSYYDHYFTEKLSDCILAGSYPIYYGCPNLEEYYPDNSYARIDIADFDRAIEVIDQVIAQNFDKKYRQELLTARDLTLEKHNLFPMLAQLIQRIEKGEFGTPTRPLSYGQKLLVRADFKYQQF